MSKSFIKGLDSLLEGPAAEEVPRRKKLGRPTTQTKIITKSSQEGTRENETRATFIVNEGLLDDIKAIAYWERSMIKDILDSALRDAVAKYKRQNEGELKPIPKGKK